ncbi:MAG: T9SS type A sorting domain-containing protein, partial [Bacteroidota bacterium]
SRVGRKSNGGDATGVREMPIGGACTANNQKYYMPGIAIAPNAVDVSESIDGNWTTDGAATTVLSGFWTYLGTAPTSCNSAYARINGSDGQHGVGTSSNASHQDDPDLDANWMLPYDCLGSAPIPSSLGGSNGSTLAQWGYTDHPTPGAANDADIWDFYVFEGGFDAVHLTMANEIGSPTMPRTNIVSNTNITCTLGIVTFALQVYNYQQVEAVTMTANKAGSFVVDETGAIQTWTLEQTGSTTAATASGAASPSAEDGTTTLYYTADLSALSVGTYEFKLIWDDYTDCCGSGKQSTVEGRTNEPTQHECYEDMTVTIRLAEEITTDGTTTIACPCDFEAGVGFLDASTYVTSTNNNITYELYDNSITTIAAADAATPIASNSTGAFNLPSTATGDLAVVLRDNAGCGADFIIITGADCKAAPPCPAITASMIDDADGAICPNTEVCFDITAFDNLPAGGTIDFYADAISTFDPYQGAGTLLGSANINTMATVGCPASSITVTNTTVTAYEGNGNGLDDDIPEGSNYEIDNTGFWQENTVSSYDGIGIINGPATGIYISQFVYDPDEPTGCTDGSSWGGGTSAEIIEIVGPAGTDIGCYVLTDAEGTITLPSGTVIPPDGVIVIGTACAAATYPMVDVVIDDNVIDLVNGSFVLGNNGDQLILFDNTGAVVDGLAYNQLQDDDTGTFNTNEVPGMEITIPSQFCFTFDATFCNQTANGDFFVKAIINPFTEFDDPTTAGNAGDPNDCFSEDAERFELFSLNMLCPEADITGSDTDICESEVTGTATAFTINLAPASITDYSIAIDLDGDNLADLILTEADDLNITFDEISTALGGAATYDIIPTILSVSNDDPNSAMCAGTIGAGEVSVKVNGAPAASLTAATDIMGCDPKMGGEVTLTFETGTGPFEFEYEDPAGNVIQVSGGSGDCSGTSSGAIVSVLEEDFTGVAAYIVSDADNFTSTSDYFGVTDGSTISATFMGADGDFYAAQDTDDAGDMDNSITLTFASLNITGLTNLMFSIDVAEDDDGSNQDWDDDTGLSVQAAIDGGTPTTIFEVTNNNQGTNTEPMVTTGGSGVITNEFQTFTTAIVGTGNSLTLTVTITNLDSGDEDIAFDNIIITGENSNVTPTNCITTLTVCEPGTITLLSVTNEAGCAGTINTATQMVNSSISPSLVVTQNVDCDDNSGTVDLNITGGTAPYTITYPGGTANVASDGMTTISGVASSGTFTLVDDGGCETQEIFTFTNADCPLPVDLLFFDGKTVAQGILLAWQTASEQKSSHFEIERALDAKFFAPIGKVQATGTTLEAKSYHFLDKSPKAGLNYYRLKIVDEDDSFEYSKTVAVSMLGKVAGVVAYPSPAKDVLYLTAPTNLQGLEIWDMQGRLLRESIIDSQKSVQLDVSQLSAGSYVLKVNSREGVEVLRFVKK